MGPLHGYALGTRIAQVSDHPLSLNQGALYPALVRLEDLLDTQVEHARST
jgi:PadR family transcriptional regulator, regulatory protein PadR